jgi:two-component system, cell cycle sensor histidine kinase and response regulator CckA
MVKQPLALFQSLKPESVLLDTVTPKLDTFEVCRQIRRNPEAAFTLIVLIVGKKDIGAMEQSFDAGASDIIAKPVRWQILGRRIRYLLRMNESTRMLHLNEIARRENEERLHLALIASKQGWFDLHIPTGTIKVSPEYANIIGYNPDELNTNFQLWVNDIHPDDRGNALTSFHECVANGGPCALEYRRQTKQGDWIWINSIGTIVERDAENRPIRMIITHVDITERKLAEAEKAELEAQNRQLQKAESLSRMASAIAHHFNNKLQAITGNLELALQDLQKGGSPFRQLNAALEATTTAAKVSNQMLTYMGQTADEQEAMDLSHTCKLSLSMLLAAMPQKIVLETNFSAPGPVVTANVNQIQQVVTNLITNAQESFGSNQGIIHLTVKTVSAEDIDPSHRFPINWQPKEKVYACIEVSDSGCGIAEKDIERIFDPFFSSKFTGRGLGLSVVLGIVRSHRGCVTVKSEIEKGSLFRVFLPIIPREIPHHSKKAEPLLGVDRNATVLLVEDEEMVRELTCVMLHQLGFKVIEASNGVEALEKFKQHKDEIRCVISDLAMPVMDGWETLAALRKLAPGFPVVIASGYHETHVKAEKFLEQPQVFLGKPFIIKDLELAISRALSGTK